MAKILEEGNMKGAQLPLIVPRGNREVPYGGEAPSVPVVTSRVAAMQIKPKAASVRALIFDSLRREPQTCDELEIRFGLPHQTCGPRIRELALGGQVRDSGVRRLTRSGREAIVWAAAP
jgi:hypothetical protein